MNKNRKRCWPWRHEWVDDGEPIATYNLAPYDIGFPQKCTKCPAKYVCEG